MARKSPARHLDGLASDTATRGMNYCLVMVWLLLYLLTGIATAIPVVWALGWAVWGAGTSPTEYLSLCGSLVLVLSSLVSLANRRSAARLALLGAFAIWSFYLPTILGVVKSRLSDQELGLSILLWTPSDSPLTIEEQTQIRLSPIEIQQIRETGITGAVSTYAANGRFGRGKKSHVTLIMRGPVNQAIELKEPDATNVVYVQYGAGWKIFPPDAHTLERTIRIEPEAGDPTQTSVMVGLASGARQGLGVWWSK